jgi:hypothetical protein
MLTKRHTLNGTPHGPGFAVALPLRLADWLIEQGIARDSNATPGSISKPRIVRRCCGR